MPEPPDYIVRSATSTDEPFLWEMLYQALFVAPGKAPPPREILSTPELSRYVAGWGRADDLGLLAIEAKSQQPIGAAWLRLLTSDNRGYGYIDDDTPELSIAVLQEHRGRGVGSCLLGRLLSEAHDSYNTISLSVSVENPAVELYKRFGFVMVRIEGASLTMIGELK
jgi:ribosomal protein S18 acetylase RimI-like enzyme